MAKTPDKMPPSVHLDHEALTQLGMHKGKMPKVGDKLEMHATGHVQSVGETEQGRHMHVELHEMKAKAGMGKNQEKPDGDSEQMNKGMKRVMDKAVVGPKEEGSEDEDGSEA
jgi:hypothetical protein